MDRVQKAYDKLNLEIDPIKNKVREMLDEGEITPDMIDFEFYNEDEVMASYKVVYENQPDATIEKTYDIEISVIVREK